MKTIITKIQAITLAINTLPAVWMPFITYAAVIVVIFSLKN